MSTCRRIYLSVSICLPQLVLFVQRIRMTMIFVLDDYIKKTHLYTHYRLERSDEASSKENVTILMMGHLCADSAVALHYRSPLVRLLLQV
uniref:Uncharacterized protein n=1 Tax=Glossina palpalis gambiensis TaxID=67801 RepID=A0A1B0B7H2_9MUSC